MTFPAQGIVERLLSNAEAHFRGVPLARRITGQQLSEAADTISRLTADNEALMKDNARLSEEKEALAFGMRHGQSLSEDAIHAIRELLNAHDVPVAAFIDGHVGNAIVQRNQARARVTALEADVGRLRALLAEAVPTINAVERLRDIRSAGYPREEDENRLCIMIETFCGDVRRLLETANA